MRFGMKIVIKEGVGKINYHPFPGSGSFSTMAASLKIFKISSNETIEGILTLTILDRLGATCKAV